MKNKIKNVIIFILILLMAIIIVGSIYYNKTYPKQDFDVVMFTLTAGVENTSPDVINGILSSCAIPVLITIIIITLPIIKKTNSNLHVDIKIRKKMFSFQLYPIKYTSKHRIIYLTFIFIVSIIVFVKCFYVDEFIKNKFQDTKLFEEYYIDPRNVNITFPNKKRNLILILGESFETTVLSKENGGAWDYSLMPELEELAITNTSFSNNETLGGAAQVYGTTYSAAGNVAITSGIPLKAQELLLHTNSYNGNGNYLSGAYSIGEILKDNGYNLEIIMGSDGFFGGRTQYYSTNGNYKIFDVNYAIETGKMSEQDKVWWGFNDDTLFEWSKEEISNLSNENNPFNYIILTADTHFTDGYLSPNAEIKYESQYENVHAYSSKCINEFVEWIKQQDFYEDTTIVIIGDHLGMQEDFYSEKVTGGYQRKVYNVIINPAIPAKNTTNRQFTTMDLYPTILASMGAKIEGNRLALGTNLYSGEPTLLEQLGYQYLNTELRKNSAFYNKHILGDDYYIIKKANNNEGSEENNIE